TPDSLLVPYPTLFRSEYWRQPASQPERPHDLELMSEGELETHLAGQQIIELLEHQFLHPLAQLDERLEALAASIGIQGNPLNPRSEEHTSELQSRENL